MSYPGTEVGPVRFNYKSSGPPPFSSPNMSVQAGAHGSDWGSARGSASGDENAVQVFHAWEMACAENTEIINANLLAVAQVVAPLAELVACENMVADFKAQAGSLTDAPLWGMLSTANTEIINANIQTLACIVAPTAELVACENRVADFKAKGDDLNIVPIWGMFSTENTEVINANLLALAEVAAPTAQLVACENRTADIKAGLKAVPMWEVLCAENTEVINTNLVTLAQALTVVVVDTPAAAKAEPRSGGGDGGDGGGGSMGGGGGRVSKGSSSAARIRSKPPASKHVSVVYDKTGSFRKVDYLANAVRQIIATTPPGTMRMMSAGLMVRFVEDAHGLDHAAANRLFSQIRKGGPLHADWIRAFDEKRFFQRQGRAATVEGSRLTEPSAGAGKKPKVLPKKRPRAELEHQQHLHQGEGGSVDEDSSFSIQEAAALLTGAALRREQPPAYQPDPNPTATAAAAVPADSNVPATVLTSMLRAEWPDDDCFIEYILRKCPRCDNSPGGGGGGGGGGARLGGGGVLEILHTFVPSAKRGRGLAGALTEYAFTMAAGRGLRVRPTCTYTRDAFLPRRPEYAAVLEPADHC